MISLIQSERSHPFLAYSILAQTVGAATLLQSHPSVWQFSVCLTCSRASFSSAPISFNCACTDLNYSPSRSRRSLRLSSNGILLLLALLHPFQPSLLSFKKDFLQRFRDNFASELLASSEHGACLASFHLSSWASLAASSKQ